MTKSIVARLPSGEEYGFKDAKTALNLHPDATIVRYQDGQPYEEPKPAKPTKADKGEAS